MTNRHTIKEVFVESIKELVEELRNNTDMLREMDDASYRNRLQEMVMEKDEYLRTMFENIKWAKKTIHALNRIPIIYIDGKLEDILKESMIDFNKEYQDLIPVFKRWESLRPSFKMASVYAEEYVSDEEYDLLERKFKKMLDKYAKMVGKSRFRAKLDLPPYDNVEDKIDWLDRKLNKKTIDDFIKEGKK